MSRAICGKLTLSFSKWAGFDRLQFVHKHLWKCWISSSTGLSLFTAVFVLFLKSITSLDIGKKVRKLGIFDISFLALYFPWPLFWQLKSLNQKVFNQWYWFFLPIWYIILHKTNKLETTEKCHFIEIRWKFSPGQSLRVSGAPLLARLGRDQVLSWGGLNVILTCVLHSLNKFVMNVVPSVI